MHEMDGDTSYHIILGHAWLKAHKVMVSKYHQCVKAIWRGRPITIKASKKPYDIAELHYAEAALYQEFEPKDKILPFNAIVFEREEEDDKEVIEPKKPPKIRRITKPNGKVIYELWWLEERGRENCRPNPFSLAQKPEGVYVVEEPLKEALECMNDVVKNVQKVHVEVNLNDEG